MGNPGPDEHGVRRRQRARFGIGRFLLGGLQAGVGGAVAMGIVTQVFYYFVQEETSENVSIGAFDMLMRSSWHIRFGFAFAASLGFFLHTLEFLERAYGVSEHHWKHPDARRLLAVTVCTSVAWAVAFGIAFDTVGGHDFMDGGILLFLALFFTAGGWIGADEYRRYNRSS